MFMIKKLIIIFASSALSCLASQDTVPVKNNTQSTINLDLYYESGERLKAVVPANAVTAIPLTIDPIYNHKLTKITIKTNHAKQTDFDFNGIIFAHAQAGTVFLIIEPGKPYIVPALTKFGQERYEKSSGRVKEGFKALGFRMRKTPAEIKEYQSKVTEKVTEAAPLPKSVAGIASQYSTPQEEYEF